MYGSDETEYGQDDTEEPEDPSPKELRAKLEAALKAQKKQERELADLREFRDTRSKSERETAAKQAFEAAGLKPSWAPLFLSGHEGEVTAEAVTQFATQYELAPAPQQEEPEAPKPFSPTVADPSGSPRIITRAEFDELMKTNPNAASQAHREGRVQWNNEQTRQFDEAHGVRRG